MKSKIIIVAMLLCSSMQLFAQDTKVLDVFKKSYELEAGKRYSEALTVFNTLYDPASYEINVRLAYLYYLTAKYNESVVFYKKASALQPMALQPLWGMVYPLSAQENWKEVENTYRLILKLDPNDVTANYYLGYIYYNRKEYANAKKHFDVCMNQYPFKFNYLLMSGWTNYFLGNKADAKNLFGKALQYNPADSSAMQGLSLLK